LRNSVRCSEDRIPGAQAHRRPRARARGAAIDHIGVQKLKNGLNAVGVAPIAGRVSGTILTKVADLARGGRFGPDPVHAVSEAVISTVPDDKLDELRAGLDVLGLPSTPSHWRRNLMPAPASSSASCRSPKPASGPRCWCQSWKEAARGHQRPTRCADHHQHQRLPELSAARIQVADIGFKGQMVDDGDGPEEGFQVHLGGSLGLDSGFGRKLRQHKCCPASWATTSTGSFAIS